MSIYNETDFPLCISLHQVGPLHYCNVVSPGNSIEFETGIVRFTLKATVNLQKKKLMSDSDCVVPIVAVSFAAIAAAVTAGVAAPGVAAVGVCHMCANIFSRVTCRL